MHNLLDHIKILNYKFQKKKIKLKHLHFTSNPIAYFPKWQKYVVQLIKLNFTKWNTQFKNHKHSGTLKNRSLEEKPAIYNWSSPIG